MPGNTPDTQNPQIAFSQSGQTAQQASQPGYGINNTLAKKIQGMFLEQNRVSSSGKLPFTLQIYNQPTPVKFTAHLGPNDINSAQQKRSAQLDSIAGIVVQDFGFKAEILEIKGTTGSAYYQELKQMDAIFKSQNLSTPAPVTVTLEYTTYQAFWGEFKYGRAINQSAGNLINYQMAFVILQTGTNYSNGGTSVVTQGSSVAQNNVSQNQNSYANGQAQTADVAATGSTIQNYLTFIDPNVGPSNYIPALNFVSTNWNTTKYGPYPGPNKTLNQNQKITIPVPWSNVLGSNLIGIA